MLSRATRMPAKIISAKMFDRSKILLTDDTSSETIDTNNQGNEDTTETKKIYSRYNQISIKRNGSQGPTSSAVDDVEGVRVNCVEKILNLS